MLHVFLDGLAQVNTQVLDGHQSLTGFDCLALGILTGKNGVGHKEIPVGLVKLCHFGFQ